MSMAIISVEWRCKLFDRAVADTAFMVGERLRISVFWMVEGEGY